MDLISVSSILLFVAVITLLFLDVKWAFYFSIPIILLSRYMPVLYTTSNGIMLALIGILSIKMILTPSLHKQFSISNILNSPFLYFSALIFLVYYIAYLFSPFEYVTAIQANKTFLISLAIALFFGNFLIGFINNREKLYGLLIALSAVLIINLVFAPFSLLLGKSNFLEGFIRSGTQIVGFGSDAALRLGGLYFHWEAYSQYLASTGVFLLIVFLKLKGRIKLLIGALFAVLFIQLLLTNSRGSIVVFSLLSFFILAYHVIIYQKIKLGIILSVLVILAYTVASYTGLLNLNERFSNLQETRVETEFGNIPATRAYTWIPSYKKGLERPWFGFGPSFYPLSGYSGFSGNLPWPHNLYLLIQNTVGLVGLTVYWLFFLSMLLRLATGARYSADDTLSVICWGLVGAWIAFLIESIKFDGWLRLPDSWFYYMWILTALSCTVPNIILKKETLSR